MKKVVVVALMLVLVAGGVFAEGLAFGVGLKGDSTTVQLSGGGSSASDSYSHYGANLFFDAKFVEVNVDILSGTANMWLYNVSTLDLVLGVVGKFPISLGDKFVLFPFAGIDYNINLSAKYSGVELNFDSLAGTGYTKADFMSRLAILLGIGADFNLTDAMFLRAELGYGIILPNKIDNEMVDLLKAIGADVKLTQGKLPYKVCVGWKF